jgi:membrane protein
MYLRDRKTSLSKVLKILFRKIQKDELDARANAVAFNFTLSVFPALIFLFTLIPYIPIDNLDKQIMSLLGQVLPAGIYVEASATIEDIVSRPRGNLLSIGFILTLYVATNGVIALMNAFNRSYRTGEKKFSEEKVDCCNHYISTSFRIVHGHCAVNSWQHCDESAARV